MANQKDVHEDILLAPIARTGPGFLLGRRRPFGLYLVGRSRLCRPIFRGSGSHGPSAAG